MKLEELMAIVDKGYGDGNLLEYFNKSQKERDNGGDTLALFIVREIEDTFEPTMTDSAQLDEAVIAIDNAVDQLMDVRFALDTAITEKRRAGKCLPTA